MFKKGLKKRGKILNLSGKKIGDEGVKHLVDSGILKNIKKLKKIRWKAKRMILES